MADYRFYFHPVRYTSLGLSLCEAMTVGVPVVGLATTELPTVIDDGVNGVIDTDPDRLVDAMRALLDDPALARRLGARPGGRPPGSGSASSASCGLGPPAAEPQTRTNASRRPGGRVSAGDDAAHRRGARDRDRGDPPAWIGRGRPAGRRRRTGHGAGPGAVPRGPAHRGHRPGRRPGGRGGRPPGGQGRWGLVGRRHVRRRGRARPPRGRRPRGVGAGRGRRPARHRGRRAPPSRGCGRAGDGSSPLPPRSATGRWPTPPPTAPPSSGSWASPGRCPPSCGARWRSPCSRRAAWTPPSSTSGTIATSRRRSSGCATPAHMAGAVAFALAQPPGCEVRELVVTPPQESTWN